MLDSSILYHLLKLSSAEDLQQSSQRGTVYETFVLSELVKANTYAAQPVDLSFYRTSDGKEIDFVLHNGKGLVLLEVKAVHSVTPADFWPISYFIGQNPGQVVKRMVLYAKERGLPFGESDGVKLWAVPLGMMAGGGEMAD